MTPPEELYSAPWKTTSFGDPKFVWFNTLNTSARNCKFNPSLILTLFNSEVSTVNRPGPRNGLRPTFPKVRLLTDHQIDAAPHFLLETRHCCRELICAHRKQRHIVVAVLA